MRIVELISVANLIAEHTVFLLPRPYALRINRHYSPTRRCFPYRPNDPFFLSRCWCPNSTSVI